MKLLKAIAITVAASALFGCQPPTFSIFPGFQGTDLVFFPKDDGEWPFGWGLDGVDASFVQVRSRKQLLWAIAWDRSKEECTGEREHHPFPLRYGETPTCFVTLQNAQPLPKGEWINIDTMGFRDGSGMFRLMNLVQSRNDSVGYDDDWPNLEPRSIDWLASPEGQEWLKTDVGQIYRRAYPVEPAADQSNHENNKAPTTPTAAASNATTP